MPKPYHIISVAILCFFKKIWNFAFCFCFTCSSHNSAIIKHNWRLSASSCDLFHFLNFSYVLKSYLNKKAIFTQERHYMMLQFQEAVLNILKKHLVPKTTVEMGIWGGGGHQTIFCFFCSCNQQLKAPHFLEPSPPK